MTRTIEQLARMQSRLFQTFEQVIEPINTEELESDIEDYADELAKQEGTSKSEIMSKAREMADQLTKQCRQSRLSFSASRSYTNS